MNEWQKPVKWAPGDEKPRGPVQVRPINGTGWYELGGDWGRVAFYRLPDTPEGRREAARIRKANSRAKRERFEMSFDVDTWAALLRIAGPGIPPQAFMLRLFARMRGLIDLPETDLDRKTFLRFLQADAPEVVAFRRLPAPFKVQRRFHVHERAFVREWLIQRDGPLCAYCGVLPEIVHIDHVVSVSRGGSNLPENLVLACNSCNTSKNHDSLDGWLDRLIASDRKALVHSVCLFLLRRNGLIPEDRPNEIT